MKGFLESILLCHWRISITFTGIYGRISSSTSTVTDTDKGYIAVYKRRVYKSYLSTFMRQSYYVSIHVIQRLSVRVNVSQAGLSPLEGICICLGAISQHHPEQW